MPAPWIGSLEDMVHGDLQPDLTLLLDLPVDVGMLRASRRSEADRIEQESLAFFERVRAAYLQRAQAYPERFTVIDASVAVEEVWSQVERILHERLIP